MTDDPFERYLKKGLQYMGTPDEPIKYVPKDEPIKPAPQDDPPGPDDPQGVSEFERALETLINQHSLENDSGTPDFILAGYLQNCLLAFNGAIRQRANWRGESVELPALESADTGSHHYPSKRVPLIMYEAGGRRNPIGEADVMITPGEAYSSDEVSEVVATFDVVHHKTEEMPTQMLGPRPSPHPRDQPDAS